MEKIGYITEYKNSYRFDRRFFLVPVITAILLLLVIGWQQGFKFDYNVYYECKQNACENPLMGGAAHNALLGSIDYNCKGDWCTQPILDRGVYGTKPSGLFKQFPMIMFSMLLLAFVVNHFAYNKGKNMFKGLGDEE